MAEQGRCGPCAPAPPHMESGFGKCRDQPGQSCAHQSRLTLKCFTFQRFHSVKSVIFDESTPRCGARHESAALEHLYVFNVDMRYCKRCRAPKACGLKNRERCERSGQRLARISAPKAAAAPIFQICLTELLQWGAGSGRATRRKGRAGRMRRPDFTQTSMRSTP